MTPSSFAEDPRNRFSFQMMTLGIVTDILARADNLSASGEYIMSEIRELSGARTVLLFRSLHDGPRLIGISPERRRQLAEHEATLELLSLSSSLKRSTSWQRSEQSGVIGGLLDQLSVEAAILVPLCIGAMRVGTLLLLDVVSSTHTLALLPSLDMLSTVIALVLRHSFLFEHQEEVIAERTRSLEQSEKKYRLLAEGMKDVVWTLDVETMRFLYISPSVMKLRGYTAEEVAAAPVDAAFTSSERENLKNLIRTRAANFLSGKESPDRFYSDEIEQPCKDGSTVWTEVVSTCYLNDETGRVSLRGVTRDITDRKHLENQLRQSQKMEAVGQLAGGVAHDFNNLLQVILGHSDLLRREHPLGTPAREAADEVHRAGERAAELTHQLLAFGRRQIIQPVSVNLNDLIQGVLKMLRRVIGEHIELSFAPGVGLGTVFVDKGQIEQVLMNLCVNARDAMPLGGRLMIETDNANPDAAHVQDHPCPSGGRYVRMTISDTGHGMDAATRAHIFEPFFTTKGVGKGTGLGLATVYGIVHQHGGLIHVESEPGAGTVFNVYLPVIESQEKQTSKADDVRVVGGTETILVAEDDPPVLRLVTTILRAAGYAVVTAADGVEALRVFEEHKDKIALVLLDVMMPGMSGRQVMDSIKENHDNVQFLFSSGYSENAIHTDFVIHEGLCLIQKPYSRQILLREVRRILDAGMTRELT